MKKCTLNFDMWLHSIDEECPAVEPKTMDDKYCKTCKWFKEV